jgi:hypothetical protein
MKESIKNMLANAMDQGIDPVEIKKLREMMAIGQPSPTKKYKTRAERVSRRKMQKESRRRNRGVNQGKRAKR